MASSFRVLAFAFGFASIISNTTPAQASGVVIFASRHVSTEALLQLAPPPVEAPKAPLAAEEPPAQQAPAVLDEPRPASPDAVWASSMRAFAER